MATVTSVVDAFMVALADKLALRANLAGVQIATGWLGGDSAAMESIQLTAARAEQRWGMVGNRRRDEEFTVEATIWVTRAGKNETVIREVRARAFALLAEIEDCLRVDPTVDNTVRVAQVSTYDMDQGATTAGRWCQLDFEILVNRDLRSS